MKKNAGLCAALFLLQMSWAAITCSAERDRQKYSEEIAKQESIYKSQGDKRPEGYVIDRSLVMYTETLIPDFERELANLGPRDRWLDIGAGMGQAILDYSSPAYPGAAQPALRGGKAQAVAMSIEDRRTAAWHQAAAGVGKNQLQYLFDRRLGEYSLEELGQFQVITDVIGGFSYTENLAQFMEKVLGFLVMNGSFYTVLQDVHADDGKNKPYYAGAPFLTEIQKTDGSEIRMCSWLKSISCVEVTCEFRTGWKPPIEVYRIRKVCNNVKVPALVQTHFQAGTPPERRFRLQN